MQDLTLAYSLIRCVRRRRHQYTGKLYVRFLAFRVLMVCVSRLCKRVVKLLFSTLGIRDRTGLSGAGRG